ncbi:MAG: serine/threonine-protein kinase, partial [Verrucomicrobiales bacterium]
MKTSSSENFRVAPLIPDHEMLRLIGKGSYGEVWLARSVTGAMRAVKVVQREDFHYERTFEREFEGIRKFEPISRSHPGLVDVLHVGRNLDKGFYYYVMELGDDQIRGSEIIPELYVARTLSSDINQRENGRLGVDECVEAGANLADGLQYLHQRGLTHRDVKPSNVIFVEGVAKLADIGLVAASGQRTFVGTEGFVPPEGPGSPAADIYSLGMVLYEVSTGNDRLEFPELPRRLPEESERPKWRALNAVVCKACSQKPKDRFPEAADFALALRRIKSGHVRRKTLRGKLFRTMVWSGLLAALIMLSRNGEFFEAMRDSRAIIAGMGAREVAPLAAVPSGGEREVTDPVDPDPPVVAPVKVATGRVKISSDPRVQIFTPDGKYINETDDSGVKTLEGVRIGPVSYVLKRNGFADKEVSG